MKTPRVFVRGFDRPNISLRVDRFASEEDNRVARIRRVLFADKPGIIYVATRRNAETIMTALTEHGASSLFYHGGLRGREREEIQERFKQGGARRW